VDVHCPASVTEKLGAAVAEPATGSEARIGAVVQIAVEVLTVAILVNEVATVAAGVEPAAGAGPVVVRVAVALVVLAVPVVGGTLSATKQL